MSGNLIYIVDDDADVRQSLAFFLGTANFATRTFADPRTFIAEMPGLSPGCVLLDVRMPGIDGFAVLEQLDRAKMPLPVVVMTGHGDIVTAVRAMKLGALDFIEKPFDEDALIEILAGAFASLDISIVDHDRRRDAKARIDSLTEREREVLTALLVGRSNKVIAFELEISVRTVEMHRAAMMDRLRVRTFAEALRLALDGGIELDAVTLPAVTEPAH